MATQITRILLSALVLSLGFGQLLRLDILGVPLAISDIIVAAVIVLNIKQITKPSLGIKLFFVGLSLGWLYAAVRLAPGSLVVPALYTVRLTSYLALYSILQRTKIKISIDLFFISGLVSLFIGYLQYILMPDMRTFQYLGWDDHLGRLTLPHFDPTYSSVMFTLFALLSFETKRYYLAALALPAILLSYARSVWLTLGITLMTKLSYKKMLVVLALFVVALVALPRTLGEGTNLLRTYSVTARLSHDVELIKQINWGMLTGVGYNTLWAGEGEHASGANNSYLQILLTTGIIGLIGALMTLRQFGRSYPFPMSLAFVLIASLFNNVLLYPTVMLWLITSPSATSESR